MTKKNQISPAIKALEESHANIIHGITKNLDLFLAEMGEGFCFSDSQVSIKLDEKTHIIDLVLFHRGIPCTVLVSLKNRKINSDDINEINKYVSYWRESRQYEYEKDAIGLVLCKEKNNEEVAYALEGLEEKIFVATYNADIPTDKEIKKH